MKLVINHYGRIRGGKVIFDIPDLYHQEILGLEGKDIVMTIKKRHQKPSLSQYAYYRGVILLVCYQSNMFSSMDNKDAIHELYFAPKFLSYKIKGMINGKDVERTKTRSLSELDKDEMTEFITKVIADCAENGIDVPPPELAYSKYYTK